MGGKANRWQRDMGAGTGQAYSIIGLLLAGMLVWGAVGLGLDLWLGFRWLFLPIGLVLGTAGAIYLVYLRYGRDSQT